MTHLPGTHSDGCPSCGRVPRPPCHSLRRTSSTSRICTHPGGWAPGAPPCPSTALGVLSLSKDIWTFLSSLGENGFFTILLVSNLAASFEPEPGGFDPKRLLAQVGDAGLDAFYGHPNDLVVDTGSVWSVDATPDYALGTASPLVPRILLFNPEGKGVGQIVRRRGVHHNNLFAMPETMAFLQSELI